MEIIERPSPNCDDRPAGPPVDMLVLHYTGMPSLDAALERMVDPAAKVSAHYCVDEDGTVFRLVAETARDWENWSPIVKTLGFTDPEVISTFAAAVGPTVGWLKTFGVKFDFLPTYFITALAGC